MKNIKSYNEFLNERFTENFPVRHFDKWTVPEKPYKRKLTQEECQFMSDNFSNYAFSNSVDKNGYILLGAGEGDYDECKNYITEEDLKKFMSETVK
jgi:hypothetical protein